MITPPYLEDGSTIGITSTARKISKGELQFAIDKLEAMGFKVLIGSSIGLEDHQFAGNDKQRAHSFQELLDNEDVKAILCARGGYGTVRILDLVNWKIIRKNPKWICGYSDVTVLHSYLHQNLNMQTLHCSMPINFEKNSPDSIHDLMNSLMGKTDQISFEANLLNRKGNADGILVGGNLSILYSLLGSDSQIDTKGKILFIEDLDEYLYHIDRMLLAMRLAGVFDKAHGLLMGDFSDLHDNTIADGQGIDNPFGQSIAEMVQTHWPQEKPIHWGVPVGHGDQNESLVLGAGLNQGGHWVDRF